MPCEPSAVDLLLRKLRRYLDTFESIFILDRYICHESGTGYDLWMPSDSGIATYLMNQPYGEGAQLSLIRISILKALEALR